MTTTLTFSAVSSAAVSFFHRARKSPRATAAEILALFRARTAAVRAGDEATVGETTNQLVSAHLYLVAQVVDSYRGDVDADELISAGCRALMQAVNSYDAARGSSFAVYATQWVKQAVARAQYRSHRGSAPFNYRAEADSRKMRAAAAELGMELGRTPTLQELAARSGRSTAEVRELLNAGLPSYSLQQPLDEDGATAYGDNLADTAAGTVYDALDARCAEKALRHNISLFLHDKEQTVILRRLGLGSDHAEASFETIAREMGISPAHAKQLFREACRRLRALPDLQQMHADLCA